MHANWKKDKRSVDYPGISIPNLEMLTELFPEKPCIRERPGQNLVDVQIPRL